MNPTKSGEFPASGDAGGVRADRAAYSPPEESDESRREAQHLATLATRYGLEFLNVVPSEWIDHSLVEKLSLEWARSHCVLPVRSGQELGVLLCDPEQFEPQEYLALLLGAELRPILTPRSEVLRCIERCYLDRRDRPESMLQDLAAVGQDRSEARVGKADDLLQVTTEAPVTQLVNSILLEAVRRRASDVHVEPFEARVRVRFRIDGVLYEQPVLPKHVEEALVSRLKIMGHLDIAERRLPQDGMARVRVGERELDVRISTVPVAEGERVVLRLLDRDSALLPLESLGMPKETFTRFDRVLKEPTGLILVCGPTGSGKTTTLYAALRQLDAARRNILTIEDPIEYKLPEIGQIQVKPKIGLTFASGLRHMLRQDPDVMLVGETRDLETAEIAIRAALTGHLVFTTLHTNDAPSAVARLTDMGVEPYLLASCLRAALAQRLVRRLCRSCRVAGQVTAADLDGFGEEFQDRAALLGRPVWAPAGCAGCIEGYRGREGIFELMTLDSDLQDFIRSGPENLSSLRRMARQKGMRTLVENGLDKVWAGSTTLAEILFAAR